jgi:sulfofructose kinase
MTERPKILCVGALTQDTIFQFRELPTGPGKFLPLQASQIAAGMASSAATAARRQGADVSLWASVGDDSIGLMLVEQMESEGIDCSHIRRVEGGRSAIATILVDAAGERLIVPYYDPVTQADPRSSTIDFGTFDAVLVDTRWPGAAAMALNEARRLGIPAILDADVAPKPILERLLPLASHIVASLPACHLVLEEAMDAREATERLYRSYGVFAAVTDGSKGTYFSTPAGDIAHVRAYEIEAVDTLAAGDVFHGAFAARLAETGDESDAIALGSAAAALKCLRFGGRLGAPTRIETLNFMQERASRHP